MEARSGRNWYGSPYSLTFWQLELTVNYQARLPSYPSREQACGDVLCEYVTCFLPQCYFLSDHCVCSRARKRRSRRQVSKQPCDSELV